ncbi:hypothetical protein [Niveibacterium sp. SC-1]|uniref:hypothetical protein n=1 Tax=Niveibacterium sp. SC-1 TaxID=3135646 RepID=UPI00311EF759
MAFSRHLRAARMRFPQFRPGTLLAGLVVAACLAACVHTMQPAVPAEEASRASPQPAPITISPTLSVAGVSDIPRPTDARLSAAAPAEPPREVQAEAPSSEKVARQSSEKILRKKNGDPRAALDSLIAKAEPAPAAKPIPVGEEGTGARLATRSDAKPDDGADGGGAEGIDVTPVEKKEAHPKSGVAGANGRGAGPAQPRPPKPVATGQVASANVAAGEVDLVQLLNRDPPAAGGSGDDYARYLNALHQASYATRFATPLVTDESFVFTAAIAPEMSQAALSGLLERMDEPEPGEVAVARSGTLAYDSRMSAVLEGGDAFQVKPLDESPTQRVGAGRVTVWRWNVTPLRPGLQRRLTVRFYVIPALAEAKDATEVKLLSRAVSVDWTWSWVLRQDSFRYVAGGVGAILMVLLAWGLKRFLGDAPRARTQTARSAAPEEPLPRILP